MANNLWLPSSGTKLVANQRYHNILAVRKGMCEVKSTKPTNGGRDGGDPQRTVHWLRKTSFGWLLGRKKGTHHDDSGGDVADEYIVYEVYEGKKPAGIADEFVPC
ncbi:hypothetical protein V9T40_007619 [Parthenolecanium corni]|uniref:Uncharacterized protein n=1 Tax=Parthenolecanium corni TaxID=536013 RepID=A0AAN9TLM7_9HEMI